MAGPHGWGPRRRRIWSLACLATITALALGGSALGASLTISTVAGDGSSALGGDDGPATLASLDSPASVAGTPDGGYLIADQDNDRIRRVAPDGMITTALDQLCKPQGVASLPDGGYLVADTGNHRVLKVASDGGVSTLAGTMGSAGYSGDDGDAADAQLNNPRAAVPTADGGVLIADTDNHVVRYVSPVGTITTVAGTGVDGYDGDGGPATSALLDAPDDVAPLVNGGFLIADADKDAVRKVSPGGTISTVAGSSSGSDSSSDDDDEEEENGDLEHPSDVEPLLGGGFLVADHGSDRVLEVAPNGSMTNFAGTGSSGSGGDGGLATEAELKKPHGLSLTIDGDVLIADTDNNTIRRVDSDFVPAVQPLVELRPEAAATQGSGTGSREEDSAEAPAPVVGESVVVAPGFGLVKVKRPGSKGWTMVAEGSNIPVGSLVNARKGSVVLTSALDGERTQTGTFWGGVFQVRQAARSRGMTDLVLRGRAPHCRRSATTALSSGKRRPRRRLWAQDDHGRFRTHGRDSVATTRGTTWYTEDRCKGTLTRVKEGAVRVRHRHSRRSVLVSAGERYLAPSGR